MHFVVKPIESGHDTGITAYLFHELSHGAPSSLGFLERNDFLFNSYIDVFAFTRLLAPHDRLRDFLHQSAESLLFSFIFSSSGRNSQISSSFASCASVWISSSMNLIFSKQFLIVDFRPASKHAVCSVERQAS
ncbi:hypothetical protein RF11_08130 [Thelohanellus kitauei]|uniref:Uncharacterized protein n=1 Tax=Thelohanellus kitauei TaxID=669202 RepID=A0A0C2IEM8_THEKT|nr:hypothetical protein RF11_08130 [Thelohanellus kitauei]